jgi:hypothetical protein
MPGIRVLSAAEFEDVHGRDQPGHDDVYELSALHRAPE